MPLVSVASRSLEPTFDLQTRGGDVLAPLPSLRSAIVFDQFFDTININQ
jgi:hypothetical protein